MTVKAFEGLSAAQIKTINKIVEWQSQLILSPYNIVNYWNFVNVNTLRALISKGHIISRPVNIARSNYQLHKVYDDAIKAKAVALREQAEVTKAAQEKSRAVIDKLRNKIIAQLVADYGLEEEMIDIILWERYTPNECWRIDVHLLQEVKFPHDGSVYYKSYVKVITHSDGTHEIGTTGTGLQPDAAIEYARLLSSAVKIVQDGILDGHKIDEIS